jgi:hypothetical protein
MKEQDDFVTVSISGTATFSHTASALRTQGGEKTRKDER